MQLLQREALGQSKFDPLKLRETLWNMLRDGKADIVCKSTTNTKVLYIKPHGSRIEPPWDLWARIFQWFGKPHDGKKWRLFWYPAPYKRMLPRSGEPIKEYHVNGGYSYPCNSDTIVIYRIEEVTRVLIHELLHAACLDPPTPSLPIREANTETWAELFLIAICSEGDANKAAELWKIQSQWIANQNKNLYEKHHVQTPEDYAWRYTVGRSAILASLKIELPEAKAWRVRSNRLTSPDVFP